LRGLFVDVPLRFGVVVKWWVTEFDEVGFQYYEIVGIRLWQPDAYTPGTTFDNQSSEVDLLDERHIQELVWGSKRKKNVNTMVKELWSPEDSETWYDGC
jgi:hypothetical protein